MPLYDITHSLHPDIAVWPGDTPYSTRFLCRLQNGDSVNLSSVEMSVHTGTHADAPFHYEPSGATIDALPLEAYVGLATVVDVTGEAVIKREQLGGVTLAPRVLFKTGAWTDTRCFPETIPVMESGLPAWLAAQGVVLVGLDVPSVDAIDSKTLPLHHELGAAGIAILESLALDAVPSGTYDLIALPLKLAGADGAPVRAILRTLDN
jgi:arylformamidase